MEIAYFLGFYRLAEINFKEDEWLWRRCWFVKSKAQSPFYEDWSQEDCSMF